MPEKTEESYGYFDCYPFTREQAVAIKRILESRFEAERVERFINEVRSWCEGAACLLDQPDFKTYKNDRKSMVAILEKASGLLDELGKGRLSLYHLSNWSLSIDDELGEEGFECQELAFTIDNLLRMLIRKIKHFDSLMEQPREKGRPSADSKGIIAELARIWENCFEKKPTKYIGGPFVEVVQIVLKGLNLPYEYPERKIRSLEK